MHDAVESILITNCTCDLLNHAKPFGENENEPLDNVPIFAWRIVQVYDVTSADENIICKQKVLCMCVCVGVLNSSNGKQQ